MLPEMFWALTMGDYLRKSIAYSKRRVAEFEQGWEHVRVLGYTFAASMGYKGSIEQFWPKKGKSKQTGRIMITANEAEEITKTYNSPELWQTGRG